MHKIFILIFGFVFSFGYAQPEGTSVLLEIKPSSQLEINVAPKTNSEKSVYKLPSMFDFSTDKNSPSLFKPKEKGIFDQPKFKNPGEQVKNDLNNKLRSEENNGDMEQYKRHQYFGDFKTESKYVKVVYRDHIYFDGDRIRVYLNDQVIHQDLLLQENYKSFSITLQMGFNKIDFQALNQGTSGPNTAEFQIFDDKGNLISSNQWELATGFKGSVIIYKNN